MLSSNIFGEALEIQAPQPMSAGRMEGLTPWISSRSSPPSIFDDSTSNEYQLYRIPDYIPLSWTARESTAAHDAQATRTSCIMPRGDNVEIVTRTRGGRNGNSLPPSSYPSFPLALNLHLQVFARYPPSLQYAFADFSEFRQIFMPCR